MTKENQTTSTLEQYIQLLQDKKNIILQGAPGTGKTYTTASLAVRLCNPNFSDWGDRTAVLAAYEELRQGGQIAFCTFHQSLDYEDFIEGLKPQLQGSHVTTISRQASSSAFANEHGGRKGRISSPVLITTCRRYEEKRTNEKYPRLQEKQSSMFGGRRAIKP